MKRDIFIQFPSLMGNMACMFWEDVFFLESLVIGGQDCHLGESSKCDC